MFAGQRTLKSTWWRRSASPEREITDPTPIHSLKLCAVSGSLAQHPGRLQTDSGCAIAHPQRSRLASDRTINERSQPIERLENKTAKTDPESGLSASREIHTHFAFSPEALRHAACRRACCWVMSKSGFFRSFFCTPRAAMREKDRALFSHC